MSFGGDLGLLGDNMAALPTVIQTQAKKQGYLSKTGKGLSGWKKRWFVLDDESLRYFTDNSVCPSNHLFAVLELLKSVKGLAFWRRISSPPFLTSNAPSFPSS